MKKIIYIIMFLFVIGLTSASFTSLGIFQQNKNVELVQLCANCTYNNITSVRYPNGTVAISNVVMQRTGSEFNYTLDSSYTNIIGEYLVNGVGDPNGIETIWAYNFEVTKDGEVSPQIGDNTMIFVFIGVLILSIILLSIGIYKEDGWSIILAGFLFVAVGVYIHLNGLGALNDQMTGYIALILIGAGAYIGFRGIEATGFGESFPRE